MRCPANANLPKSKAKLDRDASLPKTPAFKLIESSRVTRSNGRGIAKGNLLAFGRLVYKAPGNAVVVRGEALK